MSTKGRLLQTVSDAEAVGLAAPIAFGLRRAISDLGAGKHTPGPWVVQPEATRGSWGVTAEPNGAFITWAIGEGINRQGLSNARLIAAAPELLDALKEANALLLAPAEDIKVAVLNRVRAAIRKAEGSSMTPLPETGISIGGRDER